MLINPDTHIVIRNCPLNKGYIACDLLNSNLRFVKQLGIIEGDDLNQAFATFANLGLIEPNGFFNSNELTFNNLTEYYWGNSK